MDADFDYGRDGRRTIHTSKAVNWRRNTEDTRARHALSLEPKATCTGTKRAPTTLTLNHKREGRRRNAEGGRHGTMEVSTDDYFTYDARLASFKTAHKRRGSARGKAMRWPHAHLKAEAVSFSHVPASTAAPSGSDSSLPSMARPFDPPHYGTRKLTSPARLRRLVPRPAPRPPGPGHLLPLPKGPRRLGGGRRPAARAPDARARVRVGGRRRG